MPHLFLETKTNDMKHPCKYSIMHLCEITLLVTLRCFFASVWLRLPDYISEAITRRTTQGAICPFQSRDCQGIKINAPMTTTYHSASVNELSATLDVRLFWFKRALFTWLPLVILLFATSKEIVFFTMLVHFKEMLRYRIYLQKKGCTSDLYLHVKRWTDIYTV